ncbi:hypothetical protein KKG22_03290 [Patescibacteria group bacterium]|nr:hypothetical protein [Patescibacteria group bacterium]MBU1721174.1 hypothetical protein [Patescibacteria group bacterium]MBU1900896.1 hypothetical protein [Patescibacteria group bacterium]
MQKIIQNKRGFSFVETILYIAIISGVLVTFISFILAVTSSRTKTYVVQEVHANNRIALDVITRHVHEASGINIGASVFDSDPGVLSLQMNDVAKDPTVFSLDQDNGRLYIQQGADPAVVITSAEVQLETFLLHHIAVPNTPGSIQLDITTNYYADTTDPDFIYDQSIQTAIALH